ncbi:hypothetical protein Efla_006793 [Eimeria flavescens]
MQDCYLLELTIPQPTAAAAAAAAAAGGPAQQQQQQRMTANTPWRGLPVRSKLIYGSFVFNGSLMVGLLLLEARNTSSSKRLWQQHLQQADAETHGWRCYELSKLLREQCSEDTLLLLHLRDQQQPAAAAAAADLEAAAAVAAADSGDGGDRFCARVLEGLRECREEIYKELGSSIPPAMRPLPSLLNKPHWLKEPAWYQQLQQQQQQQQHQQQQQQVPLTAG